MYKFLLSLVAGSLLLFSCSNDDEAGNARLQVALIDAPAEYDAVNIDVQEVNVRFGVAVEEEVEGEDDSEAGNDGWTNISDFEPGVINILDLVNGEESVLVDREIPTGTLGEIRLVLGSDNTLSIGGETKALTVPSGSQSGLKIKINEELLAGVTYKLILDFDAARSVVKAGNSGKYNLKPVIHANMEAQTGAIVGSVAPAAEGIVVYAITGQDSISTYTTAEGAFLIRALEEGIYDVAAVSETDTVTTTGVEVFIGQQASAGELAFPVEEETPEEQ